MFFTTKAASKKRAELPPMGAVSAVGSRSNGGTSRLPRGIQAMVGSGFPVLDGPHYLDVLEHLHTVIEPEWYLEIGTNKGDSLKRCPGNFVSVDPDFLLKNFEIGDNKHGFFFQQTSDDFFATDFLAKNGIVPRYGFLDGLHRFEYLLRDFIAFEKNSSVDGVAVLHDCLPFNAEMTSRVWDKAAIRFWTGDVWKTFAILKEFRPDLSLQVLDAYPTGLVLVSDLDPASTVLQDAYEDVVARYMNVDIETFGVENYFKSLEIEASAVAIEALKDKLAGSRSEKGA